MTSRKKRTKKLLQALYCTRNFADAIANCVGSDPVFDENGKALTHEEIRYLWLAENKGIVYPDNYTENKYDKGNIISFAYDY